MSLYTHPDLYDSAFSYRDFSREVEVIQQWRAGCFAALHPGTVLELGAGPGRHALEFARRGHIVTAMDRSQEMCDYLADLARTEDVPLNVVLADFTDFTLPSRFDLIATFLDSASHILSMDMMLSHLNCVAGHLTKDGMYLMEMSHPRDFLSPAKRTASQWSFPYRNSLFRLIWGLPGDSFDSVSQISQDTVQIMDQSGLIVLESIMEMRRWTALEVEAAIRLSGKLEVHSRWGAFDQQSVFDDTTDSWRMILLVRRLR